MTVDLDPALLTMPWGKQKGMPLGEMVVKYRKYCAWMCLQCWFRSDFPDHYQFLKSALAPIKKKRAKPTTSREVKKWTDNPMTEDEIVLKIRQLDVHRIHHEREAASAIANDLRNQGIRLTFSWNPESVTSWGYRVR